MKNPKVKVIVNKVVNCRHQNAVICRLSVEGGKDVKSVCVIGVDEKTRCPVEITGEMNSQTNGECLKEKYDIFRGTFWKWALVTNIFTWKPNADANARGINISNSRRNSCAGRGPFY